jgi:hypothetical protein
MKTLIALLLICAPAFAQERVQDVPEPSSPMWSTGAGLWTIDPSITPSLTIHMGKAPDAYVIIHPDGSIEYGKGYTPDAAAKTLWDAVGIERVARNCK